MLGEKVVKCMYLNENLPTPVNPMVRQITKVFEIGCIKISPYFRKNILPGFFRHPIWCLRAVESSKSSDFLCLIQGKNEFLLALILLRSRAKNAVKNVAWNMYTKNIPTAQYKQNDCRAGKSFLKKGKLGIPNFKS